MKTFIKYLKKYSQYFLGATAILSTTALYLIINMSAKTEITPEELRRRIDGKEQLLILDVREQNEYKLCNIINAKLAPLVMLQNSWNDLDPKAEIVVYCNFGHVGGKSERAAQLLRSKGFEHVYTLAGGIVGWAEKMDSPMHTLLKSRE